MLLELLATASGLLATTYGHGEMMCGDIGKPRPCILGEPTASGEPFDPSIPTAAIAAPTAFRLKATIVRLRIPGGQCQPIRINDKMNPRYIGVRGFDLTPAAVELLTGTSSPYWSGKVEVCPKLRIRKVKINWVTKRKSNKKTPQNVLISDNNGARH